MLDACATTLEPVDRHADNLLQYDTVPKLHILLRISPPSTTSAHRKGDNYIPLPCARHLAVAEGVTEGHYSLWKPLTLCLPVNKPHLLMFYALFSVIPRRLKFICRRFGTLCLFHLHRQVGVCRILHAPTCL